MRAIGAILSFAVCVGFVFAAAAQQKPAARYDDQVLQDMNKYLQSKKEFQGVRATVEDQIVTLEGTVNLYVDRVNVEKKVNKIKNVDGIRNHVQVQSNVPDDLLRQTLADRLRYDRVGHGIASNVLTLDVKDGVVTLGGTVRDYPYGVVDNAMDKQIAGVQANSAPGVFSVNNQLVVLNESKK
jgi:hyperosmotically inducible protein